MRRPTFVIDKLDDDAGQVPEDAVGETTPRGSSNPSGEPTAYDGKSAPCAFERAALPVRAANSILIDLAIEACRRAHARAGALSEWGTGAVPTLSASLQVLEATAGNPEAEARLYAAVRALEIAGKAPVRTKTALLAVTLCRQPRTPQQRKECGRFACLVIAARNAAVRPDQATAFLETTTLSAAVAATRKGGCGARRVANPIRSADHPTLWAALSGSDNGARAQAEELVAAALERAEDWLRERQAGGCGDAR